MTFWALPHEGPAAIGESALSYADLRKEADAFAAQLPDPGRKRLGLILCQNDAATLVAYLGALRAGDAVCMQDAQLAPELLQAFASRFKPDWIAGKADLPGYQGADLAGYPGSVRTEPADHRIHPDLAVLLTTSGSTGSFKLVRLSFANLAANAGSIAGYLGLTRADRPITTLPLSYSYGLSVVNSHLLVGATLLLTGASLVAKPFWDFFEAQQATSLAGVPYHYQMLDRLRVGRMDLPSLQVMTQAGGRLDTGLVRKFADLAHERGWRFYVMYGQTEATARISYLPPEKAQEKAGSIGIAIPGGALEIDPQTQELIYRGPNVMMGYATEAADLARGDELQGVLRTGDLAAVDDDGFYRITGRARRFIKLVGSRVNLDEVERLLEQHLGYPVACVGEDDKLIAVTSQSAAVEPITRVLADVCRFHPLHFTIRVIGDLPRLSSGKVDYEALRG